MIYDKSAIFIDTNAFEKEGFNFDNRNKILEQYKILIKNSNYENVSVSVIDSEIKQHIKQKIKENKSAIKKHCKWIYNIIDNNEIEKNLNKNLIDYENFKLKTNTLNIDLSNINPETVMSKYFNIEYPFESSKPNEFKDAFFLESVYNFSKDHENYASFVVVTNDNGIKKAIDNQQNKKIIYFNNIEELLDSTIKYPIEDKKKIFDYISSYDFSNQLSKNIKINTIDIEEEELDINNYSIIGIYFPKIIKKGINIITVVCDMNIVLEGNFRCLDYDNSYYSNEEKDYLYKEYIEKKELNYVCQTIVEVNVKNNELVSATIVDFPEIDIDYESFSGKDIFLT